MDIYYAVFHIMRYPVMVTWEKIIQFIVSNVDIIGLIALMLFVRLAKSNEREDHGKKYPV